MKTKNILLTTSLTVLFVSSAACAGEVTHFFRDPLTTDKNFRLNQTFNKKNNKLSILESQHSTELSAQNEFILKKVNLIGNNSINFSELENTIKPYMNKKLNKNSISIAKKIEDYYKQQGYLLPVASIESTDNQTGSITIKVIEGRIRTVLVATDKNSESIKENRLLKSYIEAIVNLSPAKVKDVEKYLLLIEKIPGYQIEYQLRRIKSTDSNVADLLLEIKKTKGTLSLDATNHGNRDLGRYQYSAFAKLNNPFGYNESVILSTGTSNYPDSLALASLGYLKRLNAYGTSASFLSSWLEDNPYKHSKTNKGKAEDNKSLTFKGTLSQYLVLNNDNSFKIEAGAEYRDTKNNTIGQKSISYDYTEAFVKAKIKHTDFLNAENVFIPSFNSTIKKAKIKLYETGAYTFDKNFNFFTLDWFRDQPLFQSDFSLYTQAAYQYTDKKLPQEHQFFIGSNTVGRAYKSGLINSNKGSAANAEFRYTKQCTSTMISVIQPYIYGDVAHFNTDEAITNNQTTTSTFNKKTFYSVGGGFRIFFPHEISTELEAGIPLERKIKINNIDTRNRNKYSFLLSKTFAW